MITEHHIAAVCAEYGVRARDMRRRTGRQRTKMRARRALATRLYSDGRSLSEIAEIMGYASHTTVMGLLA